jgi:hypothetical protein
MTFSSSLFFRGSRKSRSTAWWRRDVFLGEEQPRVVGTMLSARGDTAPIQGKQSYSLYSCCKTAPEWQFIWIGRKDFTHSVAHLFSWDCRRPGVAGVRVRETETTATVWCICLACRYGMLGYKSRKKGTLAILLWLAGYKRNPYFPPSTQLVTSLRTGVTSKKKPKNIFFSQHRHCVAGL